MGSCYSHDVSFFRCGDDLGYERDHPNDTADGPDGSRVRSRGSSKFVSTYSKKGGKGVNQDALTVWEDFTGEKDMIFCGVFDGHGPLGHKIAQYISNNLPAKLSVETKVSQPKVSQYYNANAADTGSDDDAYGENNQNISLASWEGTFLKSFDEMDEGLARDVDSDGFCGGCTAVTVIKQGDQLIVGNLGDSRAVLCTRGDHGQRIPVQLTVDLKPDIPSEASRIHNCGGRVFAAEEEPDVCRLWMPEDDCPGLAMSRAFGDFCLKDYGLSSVPDVFCRKLTKQDEFVVLATDGVWDVLTNSQVINIVASAPRRSTAAKTLVKRAVRTWRFKYPYANADDCAVIILFLNDQSVLTHSKPNMSRDNKHHRMHLHCSGSRNVDTEIVVDKNTVELKEESEALGGLSRANSMSQLPRLSANLSEKQSSQCLKGVEVN